MKNTKQTSKNAPVQPVSEEVAIQALGANPMLHYSTSARQPVSEEVAIQALGANPMLHYSTSAHVHYVQVTRPCGHKGDILLYAENQPTESRQMTPEMVREILPLVRTELPRGDWGLKDCYCSQCATEDHDRKHGAPKISPNWLKGGR